ncbi:MAG: glycosyltransferase family 39 protein [Cyanobacteriota bacterium]|nr:glycosyltransferase family 39 protein [Cyanobacteriota bacterium]
MKFKVPGILQEIGVFDRERSLPIAIVLGVATILRIYQLGTEALWIDEMLSIEGADNPPAVRPFYFILLRFWMVLGSSDAWLRALSVLFGLGTVYLTYELGRRAIGEFTGVASAAIIALSPVFIHHSQEIRMYSLIPFLSLAGTLALSRAFERPSNASLTVWAIFRIALLLTNANNVLILFPDMLLAAWRFRRKINWLFAFGGGLVTIGLAFLPAFCILSFGGESAEFMEQQVSDYAKPGILQIGGMLLQYVAYWPLRFLLESNKIELANSELGDADLISRVLQPNAFPLFFYGAFLMVLAGLVCLAFVAFRTERRSSHLLDIAIWGIVPSLAMLAISYIKKPLWFPRYLMFVGPYIIILVAAGLTILWNWKKVAAISIAVFYAIAVGGGLFDYYTNLYRDDWHGVARTIAANEQPGDVIIYHSVPRFFERSLPRYYRGPVPIYTLDMQPDPALLTPALIQEQVGEALPVQSRLWVVCWQTCQTQEEVDRIFDTTLGAGFEIQEKQTYQVLSADPIKVYRAAPRSS